ncbi:hypothetical protein EG329_000967 [Mollisiaceae sp. DMI_Dod_QoI]|nr:hypothetical protein EG329_000967 [Helotiales sp. DMI_Dod_QoI]
MDIEKAISKLLDSEVRNLLSGICHESPNEATKLQKTLRKSQEQRRLEERSNSIIATFLIRVFFAGFIVALCVDFAYQFTFGDFSNGVGVYGLGMRRNFMHFITSLFYYLTAIACYNGLWIYSHNKIIPLKDSETSVQWLECIEASFRNLESGTKDTELGNWVPGKKTQQKMNEFASFATEPMPIQNPYGGHQFTNSILLVLALYTIYLGIYTYCLRCKYDVEHKVGQGNAIISFTVIQALYLVLTLFFGYDSGWQSEMKLSAEKVRASLDGVDCEGEIKPGSQQEWWKEQLLRRVSSEVKDGYKGFSPV